MLFARKDEKNQKLAPMSMKIFDVILLSQVCNQSTYGLSGTLGSHCEKEFLQEIYKVETAIIPTFVQSG